MHNVNIYLRQKKGINYDYFELFDLTTTMVVLPR
jgi:hypothetical protein